MLRPLALLLIATVALTACSKKESTKTAPVVVIETSMGTIKLELNPRQAPLTVDNFLDYVGDGHFDDTTFHRVVSGFVIQGGGFAAVDGTLVEKETRNPVRNEAKASGLSNVRGTVAMARTPDPHSATAQFFINVKDNLNLNPGGFSEEGYAVFGKVVAGMEVVDKIHSVPTGQRSLTSLSADGRPTASPAEEVPLQDVIIKSVRLAAE